MKKILFPIAVLGILLSMSNWDLDEYYYHTAINHSTSETVIVDFHRGSGPITLLPGESKEFALSKKNKDGQSGINYYSPNRRVSVKYGQSAKCEFFDYPKYEIRILNLTGLAGTLKAADGWMADISFSASASEQTNASWISYTSTPIFTGTSISGGYLVSVLFTIDGSVIKVTIGG